MSVKTNQCKHDKIASYPVDTNIFAAKAMQVAEKARNNNSFLHGATLIYRNKIISCGYNHGYMHAEQACIRNALGSKPMQCKTHQLDLYVCRINRRGESRMSKPCSACRNFCKKYGITTVYYSTNEGVLLKENTMN